jgi:hypothetical protein
MRFAIYDMDSGKINRFFCCPPGSIERQLKDTESCFPSDSNQYTHVVNGELFVIESNILTPWYETL